MKKFTLTFILVIVAIFTGMLFTNSVNAANKDKVTIPDENLRQILADTLNNMNKGNSSWKTKTADSDFTEGELSKIKSIDFKRSNSLKDLTGLEYCTNVENISLEYCYNVSDLTPLANLKKIKNLDIEQTNWDNATNKAANLKTIAGLTKIESISINYSNLCDSDTWIFDNMNNLKSLTIGMNDISDTKFLLKHSNKLESVNLTSTEVSKVDDLLQLKKVSTLCVDSTHISDFSFITKLPNMTNNSTRWAQWDEDFQTYTSNKIENLLFGSEDTYTFKNTAIDYQGNLWAPDTTNCSYDASTGMITINKDQLKNGSISIKYKAVWYKNNKPYYVNYTLSLTFNDLYFSQQPTNVTVDENEKIELKSQAYNINGMYVSGKYQWYKDGVAINGATSKNYTVSSASLDDAGKYYVEVSNNFTKIKSNEVTVTVNKLQDPEVPGEDPVVPGEDPVVPGEDPVVPGEDPVVPGEDPVIPGEDPVIPGEDPEVPGEDPEVPGEDPVIPGEDPVIPGEDPEVPAEDPEIPAEDPEVPGEDPVVPAEDPEIPAVEPVVPTEVVEVVSPIENNTTSEEVVTSPQTGDNMVLVIALMIISVITSNVIKRIK